MSLLEIENLRIELPGAPPIALVDGVDLEVSTGTVVGVAGESGSGKTLTGLAALGFVPERAVVHGSVRFDGQEVLTMKHRRLQALRGNDVAMVFQDPMTAMHPMLSIGRQLTEHVRVHLGMSRKGARPRCSAPRTGSHPRSRTCIGSVPASLLGWHAAAHRHCQRTGMRTTAARR